jgi:ribonuclease T2
LNRQYDPAPAPNTTNGLASGTPVPPYTGPGVDTFIQAFGKLDLLSWMNKYWINQGASNAVFWAHEFSKHATCFSTFDVPCYGPNYVQHQEVVEFYETAIKYFQRLPTWGWLAQAGIRPSNTTGYAITDIQSALTKGYGQLPYIGCTGPAYNSTVSGSTDNGKIYIDEVWYYFYAYGRPQDGAWLPQDASVSNSAVTNCAKTKGAIKYLERTPSSLQS